MLGMPFDLISIAEKILALAAALSFIMVFALVVRKKRKHLKYVTDQQLKRQTYHGHIRRDRSTDSRISRTRDQDYF